MDDDTPSEAVVLIHGFGVMAQGAALTRLQRGFVNETQAHSVVHVGERDIPGETGQRLAVRAQDGTLEKHVDLYEAYWGDLVTRLSDQGAKTKAIEGFKLVWFWLQPSNLLRSLTLKGLFTAEGAKFMRLSMLGSACVLVLWYAVVAIVGITLLAAPLTQLDNGFLKAAGTLVIDCVKDASENPAFSVVAFLAVLAPITRLVDLLYFARRYLLNVEIGREDGARLRSVVRTRAKGVIDRIVTSGEYERVVVVAHSFGAVVAIDTLTERTGPEAQIELFTLGGATRAMSASSAWLREELTRCLANRHIVRWTDFHSKEDWLGGQAVESGTTGPAYRPRPLTLDAGLFDRVNGVNHDRYLEQQEVVEAILARPDEVAPLAAPDRMSRSQEDDARDG